MGRHGDGFVGIGNGFGEVQGYIMLGRMLVVLHLERELCMCVK